MRTLLMLGAVVVAAGCTTTTRVDTTSSAPPEPVTTVTAPGTSDYVAEVPIIPGPLAGFETDTIALDGEELLVAVADTPELRRQGLMSVPDLLDLDGMLFVFSNETTTGFWMKDTLIPLDIAFFDANGKFVDGFVMEPCVTPGCPTYRPSGSYRYALEMAVGDMPENAQELRTPGIWTDEED
jgi:uncharacterized membrane protein (UPF0127 family)